MSKQGIELQVVILEVAPLASQGGIYIKQGETLQSNLQRDKNLSPAQE